MSRPAVVGRITAALGTSAVAAAVIAATFAVMLVLLFATQEEVLRRDREAQMRSVGQMLGSAFDEASRFALSHAEAIGRRAAVRKAFAEADRDELLALSKPTWDYLKAQAGVQIFGYHGADLKYFLRVHRPDGPIDDISRGRPMVLAANRTGRAQSGLEIGTTGIVGARGIAALREGDGLIGTMEVGLDLDPILERIKTLTNAEIAVVLGLSLTGLPEQGRAPGSGPAVGDLIVAAATDEGRFVAMAREGRLALSRELVVRDTVVDGRATTMLVQPLVDFSGRLIGDVVATRAFPEHQAEIRRIRTELTVTAVVGAILAFVALAVLVGARRGRSESGE